MRNKRKVFSTFALGLLCVNILASVPNVSAEEKEDKGSTTAVSRRQAALAFVQSEKAYEFNGDKAEDNKMQAEEWQVLGTFLSNYFVPYESYLTTKVTDSKGTLKIDEDTLKNYKKALVDTLSMNEENANVAASKILSNMVDPASYAKAGYKQEAKQTTRRLYIGVDNGDGTASALPKEKEINFYDLLGMSLNNVTAQKLIKLAGGSKDTSIASIYWKDGSKLKTVMTIKVKDNKPTVSQAAFLNTYINSSQKNSVANAFFADQGIPKMNDGEDYKDYVNRVYNASMYGWGMYVDAFGNLITDNGKKRFIVLPAAMNPSIYQGVTYETDGKKIKAADLTEKKLKELGNKQVSVKKQGFNEKLIPVNNIQSILYTINGNITANKEKPSEAVMKMPTNNWIASNKDIAKGVKDGLLTKYWKRMWRNKDGVSDEADMSILRMQWRKDTDKEDNVLFDHAKSQKAVGQLKGLDYRLNENLLDQMSFKQYVKWSSDVSNATLISGGNENFSYYKRDINVNTKTLLPTDRHTAILLNVKEADTTTWVKKDSKGWQKASGTWRTMGNQLKNKKFFTKATILNQVENADTDIVESYGKTVPLGIKEVRRDNVVSLITKKNITYGDTIYPWAINFSKPGNKNDFIPIPPSNRKSTTTRGTISELAQVNTEKLGDILEEQINYNFFGGKLNDNVDKWKSVIGTNYEGTLNSNATKEAGQALGYSIFSSYVNAALSKNDGTYTGDGKIQPPSYSLSWVQTPKFNDSVEMNIKGDTSASAEAKQEVSVKKLNQLMDMSFNIMSPTQGIKYVTTWIRNTLNGVFYSWHQDITGSNSSSYTTGKTKYDNQTGFVYQVKLTDLSFTNWLKNNFEHFARFLIIAMLVAMVVYFIRGDITAQQAIFGFITFTFLIFTPLTMIDGIINKTNEVSGTFYKNKFDYFAIFQLEDYTQHIQNAAVASGAETPKDAGKTSVDEDGIERIDTGQATDEYAYELAISKASNTEAGSGVSVRWMTPKKDNFDGGIRTALNSNLTVSNTFFNTILSPAATKNTANESIRGYANSLYVTRQLSDITAYSRTIYGNILGSGQDQPTHSPKEVLDSASKTVSKPINKYLSGESTEDLKGRVKKGFTNKPKKTSGSQQEQMKHVYGVLLSKPVANGTRIIDPNKVNADTVLGVSTTNFNATYGDFNKTPDAFKDGLKRATRDAQNKDEIDKTKNIEVDPKAAAGTSAFGLYTESPYYPFAWHLMDQGMSATTSATGGMKNLLLGSTDGKSNFFYNRVLTAGTPGYNELRDYMDMASLFKVTIPYLNQLNLQYKNFVNKYGTELYKGISLLGPAANKISKNDPEYQKYWFNYNYVRLYNQYTSWVDYLYDADFAQPQKISYAGTEFTVKQPLDPSSYTKKDKTGKTLGRPMIFSESEMKYYGLEEGDLTTVEQKILEFNRNTRQSFLPLMNYYSFHDTTMTSIMAITATFEFNKAFSQSKIKGYSLVQEPQGWSLGDFSYDAYMRLILANSTGESLNYISADKASGDNNAEGQYEVEADTENQQSDGTIQLGTSDATGNIYERIFAGSGPIIGGMLVLNDLSSVYILPTMRIIFLGALVVLAILILVTGVLSMGSNIYALLTKAIIQPVLYAGIVTIAFSFFISLFMGEGARDVTGNLAPSIQFGPGGTLVLLTVAQAVVIGAMGYIIFKMYQNAVNIGSVVLNSIKYVASAGASILTGASAGAGSKVARTTGMTVTQQDITGNNFTPGRFGYGANNGTFSGGATQQTQQQIDPLQESNHRRFRNKTNNKAIERNTTQNASQFQDTINKGRQNLVGKGGRGVQASQQATGSQSQQGYDGQSGSPSNQQAPGTMQAHRETRSIRTNPATRTTDTRVNTTGKSTTQSKDIFSRDNLRNNQSQATSVNSSQRGMNTQDPNIGANADAVLKAQQGINIPGVSRDKNDAQRRDKIASDMANGANKITEK